VGLVFGGGRGEGQALNLGVLGSAVMWLTTTITIAETMVISTLKYWK
jgi:hypothetical protein